MPLEQIGQPLLWVAGFTDNGNVKTGLAVTVNVWEFIVGGAKTRIVLADNATEAGDGLYWYELAGGSIDEHAVYVAVFFTAGAADQQDIFADWVVGQTWVENVDTATSTRATQAQILSDATPFPGANIDAAISDVPDAILTRDWTAIAGAVPDRSGLNALRFLRNRWRILGGVLTVYEEDDTTIAWQGSVTTAASNPVDSIDPA